MAIAKAANDSSKVFIFISMSVLILFKSTLFASKIQIIHPSVTRFVSHFLCSLLASPKLLSLGIVKVNFFSALAYSQLSLFYSSPLAKSCNRSRWGLLREHKCSVVANIAHSQWCLKQLFVQTAGRGQLAVHEKHYHVYAPLKQFLSLSDV